MPEHLHMAIDDNIKISHFLDALDKSSQRPQDRVGLLDYMAPGERDMMTCHQLAGSTPAPNPLHGCWYITQPAPTAPLGCRDVVGAGDGGC
jgi:hypothetical protein